MEFAVDIDVSSMTNAFGQCLHRLADMRPAHREIGALLQAAVLDNFDTSSNAAGFWPSLAESTLIARARNPNGKDDISAAGGGGHRWLTRRGKVTRGAARVMANAKPLIWSKALYKSITFVPTEDYVDVGTPMIKGRTLFFGRGTGKGSIPARNPFIFRDNLYNMIRRIYVRRIFGTTVQ